MKALYRSIFLLGLIFISTVTFANTITVATNDGDWEDPSTWNLNRMPADGDIVDIPAGMTVEISTNLYHSVPRQPSLTIKVYGRMQMIGQGQINISCESVICVFGSGIIPSTGCNCNQINLGAGAPEWKGQANASINNGNCIPSVCPLPVNLLSFNGVFENGSVKLSWSTSSEENFNHYEIERSSDVTNFTSIGSVSSTGNSSSRLNYIFIDTQSSNNLSYYRLKEVDNDHTFKYSNIIAVEASKLFSIDVFPNPLRSADDLNIIISSGSFSLEEVSVILLDQVGREYFSKLVMVENQTTLTIEDLNELIPGIYMVIASGNNKFFSKKIVVE